MSNSDQNKCPQCGAAMDANSTVCKYCGFQIQAPQPTQQPQQQPMQQQQQPMQQQQQPMQQQQQPMQQNVITPRVVKSKLTAGLLGIFLGGLGIHKFYTGKIGLGILYILFCWTYIPSIIGLIEGIVYLTCPDDTTFSTKYVKQN